MIKIKLLSLLTLSLLVLGSQFSIAKPLYSLRGIVEIDKLSEIVPNKRSMAVDGGIPVSFEDQPPMIPHSIDKTRITLHENTCLSCHSKKNRRETNAAKAPKSHYKSRDGKKLSKVSTGRYFCTQCHVPQAYTDVLIENTFTN